MTKVNGQLVMPVGNTCMRSLNRLVDELVAVSVAVAISVHGQNLLDVEAHTVCIDLAVFVVDFD